jgi:N6-adenosine-specific RNA methylase IME4
LAKLEHARMLLAESADLGEVKAIMDMAQAAKAWARAQRLGTEAIRYASTIQAEAEIRLGEMLRESERASGAKGIGPIAVPACNHNQPPTLADLGLSKRQSSEAQTLAAAPPDVQEKVKSGDLSRSKAIQQERQKKKRAETVDRIVQEAAPLENKPRRYSVIYADPPWRYEHVKTESRAIENQYPTMDHSAICGLPVGEITTTDAVLFCWATSPKLAEAMRVVEAWGFTYRTCMVWVKDRIGMGYYARQQHELLLIATKGSPPVPEPSTRPPSVLNAPRDRHSAKPLAFRGLIETMYPDLPWVELFCRTPGDGWGVWGNEAE